MKIKVLLADDHTIVLEGLKSVLDGLEEIEVCGEAYNGEDVLDQIENGLNPNVVVLDINMPVMDGFTCAKRLKSKYPSIKIIILTMYSQKSFIEEILKIGIDGCLLKSNTGRELKEAIIRVVSGKSYFDLMQSYSSTKSEVTHLKLGDREIEIIKLLAEGLNSGQIAERLFISDHTVKTHRKNILRKTELHNTSQLIQFALNNQLI